MTQDNYAGKLVKDLVTWSFIYGDVGYGKFDFPIFQQLQLRDENKALQYFIVAVGFKKSDK